MLRRRLLRALLKRFALWAPFALAACTGPETTLAPAVVIAPPESSARPPALAAPSPFPRVTDNVEAELVYLGGICSPLARLKLSDGTYAAACGACPNYGERPKPSAVGVDIPESLDSVLAVDQVFRGSFRKAGVDEVAIIVSGCASAAENGGGTWLARVAGDRLEDVEYRAGDHPEGCKLLPKQAGLDRLLCTFTHGRAATSTHVLVTSYDTPEATISSRELIEVVSSLGQTCERGPGPIVDNRIESTRIADVNEDGLADVEVVVSAGAGVASAKQLKACVDGEYKGDLGALVASRKKLVLRYLGNAGPKLLPDAATVKLQQDL